MSNISSRATAISKRHQTISLFEKKGIKADVWMIGVELGYGLKISFRERAPTSATKILSKLSKEIHLEFDFVSPNKARKKVPK